VSTNAPRNVDKLNTEISAALADPNIKARLADLGGDVLALSPADFGKLIADETEKWGKVIRASQHQGGMTRPIFHNYRSAKMSPPGTSSRTS
jgi:hypothetical protein